MTVVVRAARPRDAGALSRLGEATFRETFIDGFGIPYPAADLARWMPEAFAAEKFAWRIGDQRCGVWLAEADGRPVGYVTAGPCGLPHPEASPKHGELFQLYVSSSHQGRSVGVRLFDVATRWLERAYPGPLWLGVWSGNLKAQNFYAARGFERAGEYKFPVGGWRDDEFILRRTPARRSYQRA